MLHHGSCHVRIIENPLQHAAEGLDPNITWVTQIASELELTLFDGITTQQLDEAVIQVALQNIKDDPAFDTVAARLLLKTIYKRVLGDYSSADELKRLHQEHFAAYIHRGVDEVLLDSRFPQLFDLDRLAAALRARPERTLALFGHADLFHLLMERHCGRDDKWLKNAEVLRVELQ